eukprot:389587_1
MLEITCTGTMWKAWNCPRNVVQDFEKCQTLSSGKRASAYPQGIARDSIRLGHFTKVFISSTMDERSGGCITFPLLFTNRKELPFKWRFRCLFIGNLLNSFVDRNFLRRMRYIHLEETIEV